MHVDGARYVAGERIRRSDWMEEEAGNLAREGLRTLAVACRELTQAQYEPFISAIYLGDFNLGRMKLSAIDLGD